MKKFIKKPSSRGSAATAAISLGLAAKLEEIAASFAALRPRNDCLAVVFPRINNALHKLYYMRLIAGTIGVLMFFGAVPLYAQSASQESSYTHRYARPGRATMTVYLWGQVSTSGIWQVEENVDLIELLSAAGVPGIGTNQQETRQEIILHIYRRANEQRDEIYSRKMESVLEETQDVPDLQEGDVLVLEARERNRFSFSTLAQYVGTASTLALLFLRLRDI